MRLFDPQTGALVWDSADPYAGPVPPANEGRQWVVDNGSPLRGHERQAPPRVASSIISAERASRTSWR